jgi:trehalose 6-phosphate phosphatase
MSPNAVTRDAGGWALFLDVDGTLLEIAETPQDVRVPESLKELLNTLAVRLDGALALISGRTLQDLDRLFEPLRFCAAGVHGCERRAASGQVSRPPIDPRRLDDARHLLDDFVMWRDGLIVEDKGYALALHFRRAPHLSAAVDCIMRTACERLGPDFMVQAGRCVFEIRPAGWTKGSCIRTFLRQRPFVDCTPIYIGDDLTDEDGFAAVNEFGGLSIRVGAAHVTLAQHRLPGVRDVLQWLESTPWPTGQRSS